MGLAFRAVTNTRPVDKSAVKMVVEQDFSPKTNNNNAVLRSYLTDDERRKRNNDKPKRLYLIMRKYYSGFIYI